jgi:hypothetical protein
MTKEWLSLLSSIEKVRSEYLIALAGASLFLVLSPTWLLQALGLLQLVGSIRTWLSITLLLSLCLLVTRVAARAMHYAGQELKLLRSKRLIHELSGEELGFLGEFIERDVASIQAPAGDGLAGSLTAKRLIFQASSMGDVLSGFAYGIQPWAKAYLRKRPDLWMEHTVKRLRRRTPPRGRPEF